MLLLVRQFSCLLLRPAGALLHGLTLPSARTAG